MLVLAIIVAVMAVATPMLFGPLENFRLRKAGELVQARWAKARSDAIRTGQTMVFRFQQGQSTFQIAPWITEVDVVESSAILADGSVAPGMAFTTSGALAGGTLAAPGSSAIGRLEQLPENITFIGFESVATVRDVATMGQSQLGTAWADGWSAPVFFYPDGTTSTVRLVLANSRGSFLVVKLRGLSGVSQVSDLLSADEVQAN